MEIVVLKLVIMMALLFVAMKVRRSIKRLAQPEFINNCSACGGCCSSGCEFKERNGGERL